MSDDKASKPVGQIEWQDLTVPNAEQLRDFYCRVVGWTSSPVSMGDYDDFSINQPDSGDTVAGICHARGSNSKLPAQWLIYVRVADIDESIRQCQTLGGQVLDGPRSMGGKFCVIQDPAGAVMALVSD